MNENNHELVGDADTVATLVAANNGLPTNDLPFDVNSDTDTYGDGENTPEEVEVFVTEDAAAVAVN